MIKRPRKGLSISEKLERARANRYKVIHERNLLILALIAHAGFEAHVVRPAVRDPGEWDYVLCLHTPEGQLHWKLSPEDVRDFAHLKHESPKGHYDGCKAPEKLERLTRLGK